MKIAILDAARAQPLDDGPCRSPHEAEIQRLAVPLVELLDPSLERGRAALLARERLGLIGGDFRGLHLA